MKTPREFLATHFILSTEDRLAKQDVVALVEARDAEHRAELAAAIDQAAQDACERARVEIGRLNRLLTDQARNCAHRETADRLSNQVESERALRAIDQEEIERLKGELAEAEECGSVCGTVGKQCQGCLRRMFHREVARREAIKGELAEARDALAEAEDMIDDAMEHGGDIDQKRAKKFLAAPPPAESTLVPMRCTASAGSCNSPVACGEAGKCIDARMREFVGAAESTPVKCQRLHCGHGEDKHPSAGHTSWACTVQGCRCNSFLPPPATQPAPPDDIGARLERLESEVRYLADTSTQGAMVTLENKVADLDAAVRRRWGDYAGQLRQAAALEAKGEPGTHADDICARPKCRSPRHYNIHDPERGGHDFVEPKGAKP